MDPVVAKVNSKGSYHPGEGRIPGQSVLKEKSLVVFLISICVHCKILSRKSGDIPNNSLRGCRDRQRKELPSPSIPSLTRNIST